MIWIVVGATLSAALAVVVRTAWRVAAPRNVSDDARRHALIARTHQTIAEAGGTGRLARRRAREAEWAEIIAEHQQREAARDAAIRIWAARADHGDAAPSTQR